MRRKIVKQGSATMTVSLPSSWVKKNRLEAGDEIELSEDHNTIIINNTNAKAGKKFIFDASSKKAMTSRTIVGAYCIGYDEIEISFSDPSIFKKIQESVSELIGFEIIHQTKNRCVIKELTGLTEKEFSPIFRRTLRIVCDIFDEGVESIKSNNTASIESLILRDKDVNKFANLCIRHLNKIGADDSEMTTTYIIICYSIEEISDQFKEILKFSLDNKLNKKESDAISDIASLLRKVYEFTFNLDEKLALSASADFERLKDSLKKEKEFSPVLHALISSLNNRVISILGIQSPFSK